MVEGERTEPCGSRGSSRGGSADAVPWSPGPQRPMLCPASHTELCTHGTMALCSAGWSGKQNRPTYPRAAGLGEPFLPWDCGLLPRMTPVRALADPGGSQGVRAALGVVVWEPLTTASLSSQQSPPPQMGLEMCAPPTSSRETGHSGDIHLLQAGPAQRDMG